MGEVAMGVTVVLEHTRWSLHQRLGVGAACWEEEAEAAVGRRAVERVVVAARMVVAARVEEERVVAARAVEKNEAAAKEGEGVGVVASGCTFHL